MLRVIVLWSTLVLLPAGTGQGGDFYGLFVSEIASPSTSVQESPAVKPSGNAAGAYVTSSGRTVQIAAPAPRPATTARYRPQEVVWTTMGSNFGGGCGNPACRMCYGGGASYSYGSPTYSYGGGASYSYGSPTYSYGGGCGNPACRMCYGGGASYSYGSPTRSYGMSRGSSFGGGCGNPACRMCYGGW